MSYPLKGEEGGAMLTFGELLLSKDWYCVTKPKIIYVDTDSIKCVYPLKGEEGDKEMSIMSTLSRKLNELALELEKELKDGFKADIELQLSTCNVSNPNFVKLIITEGVWAVNQITIRIDLDAPLSDTLMYIKNKFSTTTKFDTYRRKSLTLNSIIEKLNKDSRFIKNKVWYCADTDNLCMRTDFTINGISRYPLDGKISFDGKDYEDIAKHFSDRTYHTFVISEYYPEFKSYVRKFMCEIDVFNEHYAKEGDKYDLHVNNGYCVFSEVDVKSFETITDFETYYKRRKEAKLK